MAGRDTTTQKVLGPSEITFGSTVLGHTDNAGAKITRTVTMVEGLVGEAGPQAVNVFLAGEKVEADFVLEQTDFDILAAAFPGLTKVSSGGKTKVTTGTVSGVQITAAKLTFQPIELVGVSHAYDTTLQAAVPVGNPTLTYVGNKTQGYACKFTGLYVPGLTDGGRSMSFGDDSASADSTPPTATSVPADNDTGVATSALIVLTVSENVDPRTVVAENFKLIKWTAAIGGAYTIIACTVALVNAGAATQITVTPSVLAAGTTNYSFQANNIKDQSGNLLSSGCYYIDFQTVA